MNPLLIKKYIEKNVGKKAVIYVFGLRNKTNKYEGFIEKVYPQIFSFRTKGELKIFSYSEVISGEVKINII